MNAAWILRPPPPRLGAGNALVVLAVALVGATTGLELVVQAVGAPTFGLLGEPLERLWVAVITALMSGGLAAVATRARTPGGAVAACFLAFPFALVNTIVCLLGTWTMKTGVSVDGVVFCTIWGTFYGILFGGPLGAILGFAYAWPIVTFVRARRDGSLDAFDRVLTCVGAWLLVVGSLTATAGILRRGFDAAVAADVTLAWLGALTLAFGGACRVLRARWLRAVRRGLVPEFRIVSGLDARWSTDGAVPYAGEPLFACNALLVRASDVVQATAYRGSVTPTAVALVTLDG